MTDTVTSLSDMAAAVGQPKAPPVPPKTTAAERLIADDAARRERERLERRRAIREQIARRAELAKDLELIDAQLRALDARADEAASRHAATTGPLQERLQTASGAQRDKLVAAVTEANVALETELDVLRRVREPLQRQHRITRTALAELPTEAFLSGAAVGAPALLAELHAARCRVSAAEGRIERAREHVARYEPELARARTTLVPRSDYGWTQPGARGIDLELVSTLTERLRRWQAELTHAAAEQHAATAAIREIEADMVAE